ncbi:TonB-dependent receptor [Sphingomonas sp. RT2P30]|uniref:TonB-dependent receptor plug domain-containing protein n=1 Tax=Parasphingomonas halimpatiens TaxID=3096162 RepID=UPI002FCB07B5
MHPIWALVAGLSVILPAMLSAQQAPPTAATDQGVLVFPAAFFIDAGATTALDMIGRLPGFVLDIGNPDSRGLAGAAGNVLIDGARPTSKSDTLDAVLRRISAAGVERIELIRGGAPGIDMQGRAVLANVVLRRGAKAEIVVEANAYAYPDGFIAPLLKAQYAKRADDRQTELAISATNDRSGQTTRGMRMRSGADDSLMQRAALDLHDQYRDLNLRGTLERPALGGKLRVNALFDYTGLSTAQRTTIIAGAGDGEQVTDRTSNPSGEFGLNWTGKLGPRSELELTGLQRFGHTDYAADGSSGTDRSTFDSASTSGESVLRGVYRFHPDTRWAFEAGGEIAYNFLRSATRYAEQGNDVPLPNAAILVSETRGEGFAQATWHPGTRLTAEAGLRVEVSRIAQAGDTNSSRSFTYPKPRAQLTWLASAGNQLRLRVEKEVGQLNFGDFAASTEITLGTVTGGNADLRPQRDTVFEAVYEHRFWNKGVIELTASHIAYRDVIDVIPLLGGFDATGNIGTGTQDQARINLTLPFDRLGWKGSLLNLRGSWTSSRVTDPLTRLSRPLAYSQPFTCLVSFSQDLKRGRFSYGVSHDCNVDHFTTYRSSQVRTVIAQPFMSIYGQWKPSATTTLRLDLGNATNGSFRTLRDVYAGPRDAAPLLYREDRTTRRGSYLYLQVRRVL